MQNTLDALREARDLMHDQLQLDPGNASLWARYMDALTEIDRLEKESGSGNKLASFLGSLSGKPVSDD